MIIPNQRFSFNKGDVVVSLFPKLLKFDSHLFVLFLHTLADLLIPKAAFANEALQNNYWRSRVARPDGLDEGRRSFFDNIGGGIWYIVEDKQIGMKACNQIGHLRFNFRTSTHSKVDKV